MHYYFYYDLNASLEPNEFETRYGLRGPGQCPANSAVAEIMKSPKYEFEEEHKFNPSLHTQSSLYASPWHHCCDIVRFSQIGSENQCFEVCNKNNVLTSATPVITHTLSEVRDFLSNDVLSRNTKHEFPALTSYVRGLALQRFNAIMLYGWPLQKITYADEINTLTFPFKMVEFILAARHAQITGGKDFAKPTIISVFYDFETEAKELEAIMQGQIRVIKNYFTPEILVANLITLIHEFRIKDHFKIASLKDDHTIQIIQQLNANDILLLTMHPQSQLVFQGLFLHQAPNVLVRVCEGENTRNDAVSATEDPFLMLGGLSDVTWGDYITHAQEITKKIFHEYHTSKDMSKRIQWIRDFIVNAKKTPALSDYFKNLHHGIWENDRVLAAIGMLADQASLDDTKTHECPAISLLEADVFDDQYILYTDTSSAQRVQPFPIHVYNWFSHKLSRQQAYAITHSHEPPCFYPEGATNIVSTFGDSPENALIASCKGITNPSTDSQKNDPILVDTVVACAKMGCTTGFLSQMFINAGMHQETAKYAVEGIAVAAVAATSPVAAIGLFALHRVADLIPDDALGKHTIAIKSIAKKGAYASSEYLARGGMLHSFIKSTAIGTAAGFVGDTIGRTLQNTVNKIF